MNRNKLDQDEANEYLRLLCSDISALEQTLKNAGRDFPARPSMKFEEVLQSMDMGEAHLAKLRTLASVYSLQVPALASAEFNSETPVTFVPANIRFSDSKRRTIPTGATAAVCAAEGVSTLEELAEKKQRERNAQFARRVKSIPQQTKYTGLTAKILAATKGNK